MFGPSLYSSLLVLVSVCIAGGAFAHPLQPQFETVAIRGVKNAGIHARSVAGEDHQAPQHDWSNLPPGMAGPGAGAAEVDAIPPVQRDSGILDRRAVKLGWPRPGQLENGDNGGDPKHNQIKQPPGKAGPGTGARSLTTATVLRSSEKVDTQSGSSDSDSHGATAPIGRHKVHWPRSGHYDDQKHDLRGQGWPKLPLSTSEPGPGVGSWQPAQVKRDKEENAEHGKKIGWPRPGVLDGNERQVARSDLLKLSSSLTGSGVVTPSRKVASPVEDVLKRSGGLAVGPGHDWTLKPPSMAGPGAGSGRIVDPHHPPSAEDLANDDETA